MLYAIHIMRDNRLGQAPELIATYRERGALDTIRRRAHELLWSYPSLDQHDYALVRQVADGKEVYRWHLGDVERQQTSAESLTS